MVGYHLKNTLTENGHVARGVCTVDENGYLVEVTERTHIEKRESGPLLQRMMEPPGQSFQWMLSFL